VVKFSESTDSRDHYFNNWNFEQAKANTVPFMDFLKDFYDRRSHQEATDQI
jgi:hypothetical protein